MSETVTLNLAGSIEVPRSQVLEHCLAQIANPLLSSVPQIGEPWHGQGGVNAGLMRNQDGRDYWLIVPTGPDATFKTTWGSRRKDEPNATDEYDGAANTRALVESEHDHPAAERCAALTIGGHSDWYLPARRELALLYANVPELFEKAWYWSSTQYSGLHAWTQNFAGGHQLVDDECFEARVRPVRRLIL